jgi:putative DNA primase/helicase
MNNTTPTPQADTRQQVEVIPTATHGNDAKPVLVENLPVEMRYSGAFLRWQYFVKPEGGLYKSPVNRHSRQKGYDNTDIWMSYDDAVAAVEKSSAMIGISLGTFGLPLTCDGRIGYLWCLDFDGFAELNGTGVDRQAHSMVTRIDSYCEISPSTTGFKAFFVSDKLPQTKDKIRFSDSEYAKKFPDVSKYRNREIEVFSKKLFLTMTGDLFDEDSGKLRFIPGAELEELLDWLHDKAVDTGGTGLAVKGSKSSVQVVNLSTGVTHYNRLMPDSLETVLRYADCVDEEAWCDVSNALARAYGEEGRDYFEAYSRGDYAGVPYAEFDQDTVTKRFDRSLRELEKYPDGVGVNRLIELASVHKDWPDPNLEHEDALVSGLDMAKGGKLTPMDSNHVVFGGNAQVGVVGNDQKLVSDPSVGVMHRDTSRSMNDAGNADRFAQAAGGYIKYVVGLDRWLFWRDGHWHLDKTGQATELATGVARGIYTEARAASDGSTATALGKWANISQHRAKLDAMVALAKPKLAVMVDDLDRDAWLMGVRNGVVNLRTGAFREATPEDLITKIAAVEYDREASCPVWEAMLHRCMGGKVELIEFLQRAMGYTLTGLTREQVFFFMHGGGDNGKSKISNALREIMGGYAISSQPEVIMKQRSANASGPTPELARLAGTRFVAMVETEDGQRLAESRVKQMTGQDAITARVMHGNPFDFVPNFKLWLSGNHRPVIGGDDHGIWRRIVLIPFDVRIPKKDQDANLDEKLRAEYAGILNWLIKGCLDWQVCGLGTPPDIQREVNAYKSSMDLIQQWLDECCVVDEQVKNQRALVAYQSFSEWAQDSGHRPFTNTRFGLKLMDRGFTKKKTRTGIVYQGFSVRHSPLSREG